MGRRTLSDHTVPLVSARWVLVAPVSVRTPLNALKSGGVTVQRNMNVASGQDVWAFFDTFFAGFEFVVLGSTVDRAVSVAGAVRCVDVRFSSWAFRGATPIGVVKVKAESDCSEDNRCRAFLDAEAMEVGCKGETSSAGVRCVSWALGNAGISEIVTVVLAGWEVGAWIDAVVSGVVGVSVVALVEIA